MDKGYFDDRNKDSIPDGWAAAHKRMLAIDRNRDGVPDDFEPLVRHVEAQVREMIIWAMIWPVVILGVLGFIGWLLI